MIIHERENEFVMVAQHDHAKVSRDAAQCWRCEHFLGIDKKDSVVLAVREHDRCWIEPDKEPLWNEQTQQPYSFMDYPGSPKLAFYTKGIDEIVQMDPYAGLLCSLHSASFLKDATSIIGKNFWIAEKQRQQKLLEELGIEKDQMLSFHLNLLKFCDNLSLYICLNDPGTPKSQEHYFYRNGFPQRFSFANNEHIHAEWLDQETVSLSLSPFKKNLHVRLPYKAVNKKLIKEIGLAAAYYESPVCWRDVTFV
ncbi:hypothetical protein G3A_06965 [Bacillus sp. 17376]|uniref:DUF3891 family protein n=1 Tax=Mesobacillus boroniphilus JCM 21738 TaxID=1294265 RepID=W4RLS3_9BACI|nr:DUF3891 family protein [Mesobacillus boroniphilus]ESU33328.1 hypothetical protein G3A_06965 [Bacillus sp. 17376]GAE44838.1 hypothetical protein JCM21738_1585 [Mesobacillus boroniphilus JCM 21738]